MGVSDSSSYLYIKQSERASSVEVHTILKNKQVKINFQKQFGKGTDPWYAKAEMGQEKFKNPYIQHLALGFVAWLKKYGLKVRYKWKWQVQMSK